MNNTVINEYNEIPTTGKIPKNIRIFHGSPKQGLKYMKPHKSYSYPELGPVVFASCYKPFAACLCLDWNDTTARQGINNYDYNDVSLWLIEDIDFTKPCSIYELVNDGSFKVLQNHPAEIYSPNTIKVKREEQFDSFVDVIKLFNIDLYNFNTKQPLRDYSGILEQSILENENISIDSINIEKDIFTKQDEEEMRKMNISKIQYLMFKLHGETIEMTNKAESYRMNDKDNLTPLITANINSSEELEDRYNEYMSMPPAYKKMCNSKSMEIYGEIVDSRYLRLKKIIDMCENIDKKIEESNNNLFIDTNINFTLQQHMNYISEQMTHNYSKQQIAEQLLELNNLKDLNFYESVMVKKFIKEKIDILENNTYTTLRPYYTPQEMMNMGIFSDNKNDNFYMCESTKENLDWFFEYSLTNRVDFNQWHNRLLEQYGELLKDPSNKNKQRVLELGWNPEIEPSISNIKNCNTIPHNINNMNIVGVSNITSDRIITGPAISREEAIRDGGFYDNDGIWNSIIEVDGYDNMIFRKRVEVLILDDSGNIYLNKKRDSYRIPGGSSEKGIDDAIQAANEAKEEARLLIKDVVYTGIHYIKVHDKEYIKTCWFKDLPIVWDGQYTKVYIAKYNKKYNGHINKLDTDEDMFRNGRFYPIKSVYNILKPEHRKALEGYNLVNESTEKLSINLFHEYKEIKSDLSPVFIVTVFTDSIISHPIKKITNCKYTHAGISLEPDLSKVFSFNFNNGEIGGGFSIESLQRYINENKNADMKAMCIFVKKDDIRKIKYTLDNAIANVHNTSYSITNLIYILLNKAKTTGNDLSMVCSQFVDYVLRSANINIINKPNNLVTPADFAKSMNDKIYTLFEGKCVEYDKNNIIQILHKLNKTAKYIKESIDVRDEINNILESYINLDISPILEYKSFPSVEFTKDGDLLIKNYKKIKFEEEYYKSVKLLKIYSKKNNYEAMAYELSKLWFINSLLEQKIYTTNNTKKLDEYNLLRGKILNTFNRYLAIVCENIKDFNFEEYYNNTPFSDTISIKKNTIDRIIDIGKKIIL